MIKLGMAVLFAGLGISSASAAGPAPVGLGSAGTYTILSKSGITDVSASAVTGNVGTSPISGTALHLSCSEVKGNIFVVDAAGPPPCAINADSGHADRLFRPMPITRSGQGDHPGRSAAG